MLRNLAQIEAYYWVARLGSFHAAATHLGLSQPAVSARIKELERTLGVPVFTRIGRMVQLTAQGVAIRDCAERLLLLAGDLEASIGGRRRLGGLLRFGVPDSFALLCLGGFMKTLEAQQPDLRIAVTVDNSRALTLRLEDGLLDLAVLAQPQTVKDFRVEPLGVQRLVWVAASTMRLPRRTLGPKELVDRQIVTNPAPSTSFSVLMDWFGAAGLTPRHVSTCNSVAVIACVVASGAWISPLPACIIEEQVQNGALKLVPTQPPLPGQHMFAAYPKAPASQALPEVIDVIRRTISRTRFVEADI